MRPAHADEVLEIYQLGIDEGNATFEATAPTWEHFNATKLPDHRQVALDDSGTVLGWAAAVPVSDRCAYAGVVEHSVYVHPDARGREIGLILLRALVASMEASGISDRAVDRESARGPGPCRSTCSARTGGNRAVTF
ncbi:GNAT family N-acetyltransferase [Streptomyces sp. NPDC048508]|uniref:GNAT family N-acetyltransferase n=1 Tax=Streptomyces sp. NPDC048508 TaxID=3365561 RepID=UPI003712BEEB